MKLASIVLVVLLIMGGLLLVAIVLSASAGDVARAALADDTYATSAQRATTVCVGLFNLGCNTAQTSAVSAQRRAEPKQFDALELLLVLAAGTALLFVMAVGVFLHEDGAR